MLGALRSPWVGLAAIVSAGGSLAILTNPGIGMGMLTFLLPLERLQRLITGRPRSQALPEPLTDREVAVLQLLQGTLSLREIAGELHLSANTIKTHAQAIYRKLGVSTRRDATMRGREAGFL